MPAITHTHTRIRFMFVVTILAAAVMGADAAPSAALPEKNIDIGNVAVDSTKDFTVEVRNDGDAPLEITRVQTSCPCAQTALKGGTATIAAGESLQVPFVYVPDGRRIGVSGATIAIGTNDPENPVLIAELQVFIEVPVIVRPDTGVTWSMHPRGTRLSKELAIFPGTSGKDIQLKSAEVLDPAIGVESEIVEAQREDGLENSVRLHFDIRPDAPLGPLSTEVVARVIIDGEELEVSAPIRGTIIGDTLVIPPSIISPKTAYKNGDPISEIIVRPSGDGALHEIVGAIAEGPLVVEVQPVSAREQRVKVFAGEITAGGPQSGQIYVMTTSEDQPITTIPVYFRGAMTLESNPEHLVLESGAPQTLALSLSGASLTEAVQFEYDERLLRVTTGEDGATVEAVDGSSGNVATRIVAHSSEGSSVSIPVLVRRR